MPMQDPMEAEMQRRLLLAVVLSMAVLFLVPYAYRALYPSPPTQSQLIEEAEPGQGTGEIAPEEAGPPPTEVEAPDIQPTSATPRVFEVENQDLVLRWNNVGGVLDGVQLKHYTSLEGDPVEIVPQALPVGLRQSFAIRVGDPELDERLRQAVYQVEGVAQEKTQAPAEITFYYRDAEVEVRREVRIEGAGYLVGLNTQVWVAQRPARFSGLLGPGIGAITPDGTGDFATPKLSFYVEGSVERYSAEDLEEQAVRVENPRWVALDSKFFTMALLGPTGVRSGRLTRIEFSEEPAEKGREPVQLLLAEAEMESGDEYWVFIGPKDYEILLSVDSTLGRLIDYGWFAFLVRPLLVSLKFFYKYVNNYGWAIILLTFVINLALFPVRYKQTASMKKMSQLQPEIKAIQEKYKRLKRTDPKRQKMNEEVMALYKKHGVNPLGGCLPLVIQMPFLFAFYRMLYSSIELRGAPFIWWIQDLSRHDPYYVTPILMGVSMMLQQQMTPTGGDPAQRRMMMFLPLIFTFFFLNFSSGLVLYFLFSNLFGMMFQVVTQKWGSQLAPATGKAAKDKKK